MIVNNCWMVFLLSQEHMKQRRKRRHWVRSSIRKRVSKGAYYLIINDSRINKILESTDK